MATSMRQYQIREDAMPGDAAKHWNEVIQQFEILGCFDEKWVHHLVGTIRYGVLEKCMQEITAANKREADAKRMQETADALQSRVADTYAASQFPKPSAGVDNGSQS